MQNRKLTGKFYLKPRRWFGFTVMVEVKLEVFDEYDYSKPPVRRLWQKATREDVVALDLLSINESFRCI